MMAQHVPAWKKIGLKLKYAKDTTNDNRVQPIASPLPVTVNGGSESTPKRSRDEDNEGLDGVTKKRKTSSQPKAKAQQTNATSATIVSDEGLGIRLGEYTASTSDGSADSTSATPSAHTREIESHDTKGDGLARNDTDKIPRQPRETLNRKKSVTFTPETKEEDGESISAYFKAWSAEQQQPHTPPKPSTEFISETPTTPPSNEKQTPKSNAGSTPKPKEKKVKQKSAEKPSAQPKPAYLDYLTEFHNDKANWKFNKSKQNDLLKNVWSIFRIPSSYNEALYSYIAGLQGLAARQRLASGAEDILKDIAEKTTGLPTAEQMENLDARKAAYARAVKLRIEQYEAAGSQNNEYDDQQLEDIRQDVEKGKRAEAILRQTLIPILDPNWKPPPPPEPVEQPPLTAAFAGKRMTFDDEPTVATNVTVSKTPPKRKRKSRTDVSSSESSSSSSESDSDSDTSGDDSSDSDSDSDGSSSSESEDSDEELTPATEISRESSQPKRKAVFDSTLLDQAFPKTADKTKKRK